MRLSTGRWVSGDDFFNRERELALLETRVRDGNHVLLTGQRRMGKTSVARELGRRLEADGWVALFTDVEDATCAEDVVAEIAEAVHRVRPIAIRFAARMTRWFQESVEEISALDFRVKVRAGLDAGSWRRHGEQLIQDCAEHERPVLLVMDELPIFLKRMLGDPDGARRVDEFLSWLRGVIQSLDSRTLVIVVSGSIGLRPLVERLGIPDRINHLDPIRLGPWSREHSIECFERLARSYELPLEGPVGAAVYDKLGFGIPHHVQTFFARLQDFAVMQSRDRVTVEDVDEVYETALLGPAGQNDLVHYETRLQDGLDDQSYSLAMQVLAEAATQGAFTPAARRSLEALNARIVPEARARTTHVLDVLVHDGYLEAAGDDHRFCSRLLQDWWSARFRHHHIPLVDRLTAGGDQ